MLTAMAAEPLALSDATRSGNWETVRSMIAGGLKADSVNVPDSDGTRPLHWAVRADEPEIVDFCSRPAPMQPPKTASG